MLQLGSRAASALLVGGLALALGTTACNKDKATDSKEPSMATQEPPKSNLPPLNLGTGDELQARLDGMYNQGGLAAVSQWVEKELQPGREITYSGQSATLLDRSLWKGNAQGQPTDQVLVSPTTNELSGKLLVVLSRPFLKEPFVLRLRKVK